MFYSSIKNFKSNSTYNYLLSYLVVGITGFLLLPFLTKYLSKEDYGTLAIIILYSRLLIPIISLSSNSLVSVQYIKYKNQFNRFINNQLFIVTINSSLILLVINIFPDSLESVLMLDSYQLNVVLIISYLTFLFENTLSIFVISKNSKLYLSATIVKSIIEFIIVILLVVIFKYELEGRLGSLILGLLIGVILGHFFLHKRKLFEKQLKINKRILKFILTSFVFLFSYEISIIILGQSDRFFLAKIVDKEIAGIYNVAYAISNIGLVVFNAIYKSKVNAFYNIVNNSKSPVITILKFIFPLILKYSLVLILIWVAIPFVYSILVDNKYHDSQYISRYLLISHLVFSFYFFFIQYFISSKKLKSLFIVCCFSIILNLILNYLLISKYEVIGAVISTIITYFLMTIFSILLIKSNCKQSTSQ